MNWMPSPLQIYPR
uniref:Uncharacterized protein n=1 Tax=Arundo donax TaxID=35708 RepID=A0A0A9CYR8_ARUDO